MLRSQETSGAATMKSYTTTLTGQSFPRALANTVLTLRAEGYGRFDQKAQRPCRAGARLDDHAVA